tara:strand:+ start:9965 stop:12124 length:2160 start_codon:yes stop_codon:yes gene_type:complete
LSSRKIINKMKIIGILLSLISVVCSASGTEKNIIYMAPDGLDSNPGTKEKPLATLTGARDFIRELDTEDIVHVRIAQGDYFMTSPLELSSKDAAPLIFEGTGENVTFYGGIPVTNWEKVSDSLWRANTSEFLGDSFTFEQFFVNGKRGTRARTPDKGFFQVEEAKETILHKGKGRIPEFAIQKIYLNPADVALLQNESPGNIRNALITFYHKWDVTRKYINHFDPDSSAVFIRGKGMQPWNRIDGISKYYIENIPSALDAPGEWLLKNDGYVYYIPREGERIESVSAYLPVTEKFISIKGDKVNPVKNKTFKNIRFKVAAYKTPKEGNDPMQAAARVDATIMVDYADNIVFENCELAHTGLYGIWFRRQVSNSSINKCYMHDLGAGGVRIGDVLYYEGDDDVSANNLVHNSIIRDGGHLFPSAVGIIIFHSRDNQITYNEIVDLKYSGVSVGWMWGYAASKVVTTVPDKFGNLIWKEGNFKSPATGNSIAYNHIHHLGWGELSDMGGVYIVSEAIGTHVHHNKIHHIYSDTYGGWGLYTDEGASHVIMENNLVYACKSSGFHQHFGKENNIRNNIFAFNLKGQLQFTRVEKHQSFELTNNIIYTNSGEMFLGNWKDANIKMENNCYWDTRMKEPLFLDMPFNHWKKLKDKNSIVANPEFVDAENYDFRLRSRSVVQKIGFEPFDYGKAGVYGTEKWKNRAILDSPGVELFRNLVNEKEM